MTDSTIKHVTIPGLRLHLRRGDPNMLWVNGQNLLLSTLPQLISSKPLLK